MGMLAALLLFFLLGLDTRLVVRRYMVKADGLTEPVRIVLLTDFHCCDYGEEQEKLLYLFAKVTAEGTDPKAVSTYGMPKLN